MPQLTEAQITTALRGVLWNGENIVARDIVAGITFTAESAGTKVNLVLKIEPQKNTDIEALKRQAEKVVGALEGVTSVAVIFTAHHPQAPQRQPACAN